MIQKLLFRFISTAVVLSIKLASPTLFSSANCAHSWFLLNSWFLRYARSKCAFELVSWPGGLLFCLFLAESLRRFAVLFLAFLCQLSAGFRLLFSANWCLLPLTEYYNFGRPTVREPLVKVMIRHYYYYYYLWKLHYLSTWRCFRISVWLIVTNRQREREREGGLST